MKREFTKYLEEWAKKEDRLPLIVMGARQVGKTYIIDDFCKKNFKNYVNINFLDDSTALRLFNLPDFKMVRDSIQLYTGCEFDDKDTIFFFDEIQKCPYLIQHLKFLKINHPNSHIICAGSLLGVSLRKFKYSYPIGYVHQEYMYPMTFKEFLVATNEDKYIPLIEDCYKNDKAMVNGIHEILLNLYYTYLYLGGMPKRVNDYILNNKSLLKLDKGIIPDIIDKYKEDMTKYIDYPKDAIRITRIYDNIVPQLAKENPKFVFAKIDKNDNRKIKYLSSIDWLDNSDIVHFCYKLNAFNYPLRAYKDGDSYKIYCNDVGILNNLANIDILNITLGGDYPFKGSLVENYVANELVYNKFDLFYYSEKDKGSNGMEIDFVIQLNGKVIPIEVKSNTNIQSKSLISCINKFNPDYAIRISTKNFGFKNMIKSIPLYAVFCIKNDN